MMATHDIHIADI